MAAASKPRVRAPSAILAGPPGSVSGFVPFHNLTDDPVIVDQVLIRDPDARETTLSIEPMAVGPGQRVRVAVTLFLRPQTPPGAYALEATIAGTTAAVVAHVTEARDFTLSPASLVVDVAGLSVTKTVVVANEGNVPIFVPDYGDVPLYREEGALITLRAMAGGSALDVQAEIDSLPDPDAVLGVATKGGRVEIAPGETCAVELSITVPPDLSPASRYLAALPVSLRTLLVAVVPGGVEPKQPTPRSPRARKG